MGPVYRRTMISEPEILDVREPPGKAMGKVAELWKPVEGTNKIMCTACARYCKIGEGQVGLCGIRGVHEGKLWLYVYGRVITGHVDPIEKKPVSHWRPGSKIFSIATTGCNWLCRYCFLPGTQVLTDEGHVPIDRLFADSEPTQTPEVRRIRQTTVLTHRGRWRRATKAFQHLYSGKILRIRPYYLPGFDCTPGHRIFASIGGGTVREVEAKELKLGDFLAVPRPRSAGDSVIDVVGLLREARVPDYKYRIGLDISDGQVRWSSERSHGIPERLPLTADLARLLGYYCAEGSIGWHRQRPNSGAVWFSFGAHEESRIQEVERLLLKLFGARTRRSRQNNRTAVIASGASLASIFQILCGDSSATKRVPTPIVQSRDPAVLRAFVTGYFNGDGYVTRRRGSALVLGSTSISQALSFGVAQILFTLGEVPRVYQSRNDSTYEIQGRSVSRADDHMVRLFVDQVSLEPDEASWTSSPARVLQKPDY